MDERSTGSETPGNPRKVRKVEKQESGGTTAHPVPGTPSESARRGPAANQRTRVAPARACAYAVIRRVFEDGAYADRALHGEARRHGLDPRDRALATRLAYGTVQRRATLDHIVAQLAGRPVDRLEPAVLAALRLGVLQLAFLDRVPAHAAVGESVELAKQASRGGAGLVNAVLRRAADESRPIVASLPEATPAQAALKHSYARWIAELWFDALGPDEARALMAAGNEPAEAAVRINTLKTDHLELPVPTRPADHLPEGLIVDGPFDAFSSPQWEQGLFMPQSRAAMAVARALDPQPGERILDLCAAPGGKTTHLAALIGNEGRVTAVEKHAGRARTLARTAQRMGATCVEVHTADATTEQETGHYDRVLVDPPCSDLGTLASRPDVRWRKQPQTPAALAATQQQILDRAAAALKPSGVLVYSTCTISPAENEQTIAAFLERHEDFTHDRMPSDLPVWNHPTVPGCLQTLPHRHGTDGFFIARLRRS
jgi:16S rRNA (cytosine967-C5)-methyltransferase